jgi:hypothetical protein
LIGSCDAVRNPSLKSDRDVTALQREVAGADQMADRAVVNPNRQAPPTPFRPARSAPARVWLFAERRAILIEGVTSRVTADATA